ncbi:MAG: peroxiredoxin [Polyangiales bacterium]|jgi:peroxiredoxin
MLAGCGGALGSVGSSNRAAEARALEMTLRTPAGDWIHLGDLRGQPVLLFVFATWDGVSQAALRPVSRFARAYDDVHVLGVAAQPDAALLIDAYEHALDPPFPMTYDPEQNVHAGTSPLGSIEVVPTLIMLDAYGVEVGRHVGFPNTNTLPNLREEALERGGIGEAQSPPTIGLSSE